jgi:DNA-binding transcriptional ArsR family regulator
MSEREIRDNTRQEAVENRPEGYERVESELLNNSLDINRESERFKAMGEPTRLVLLYLLATEGQLDSGELADLVDRHQNDLYHHLNTLEDAGLVGKFRDGRTRVYELSPLAESFIPHVFECINRRAEAV